MNITTEEIAPREVALTLQPEAELVAEATRRVAGRLARRVKIPGFRPGKAPYVVVERTVGRDYILNEVAGDLADDLYEQALEETGLQPYDKATLDVVSLEPIVLKVTFPLLPEVDLGPYKDVRVEPEEPEQVTEEHITDALAEVQDRFSEWDPVERPVQIGDQIIMDLVGVLDGETVADDKEKDFVVSETASPPGFSQELVGTEIGETKEFTITYPEDFRDEELQGKEVAFTVTVHAVREKRVPALDDELAKSAGDYETLSDLEDALRERIGSRLEQEARERLEGKLMSAVLEHATVSYPALALEHEVDEMFSDVESRIVRQGFTLEGYLNMSGSSEEQLRSELRPTAEKRLVRNLVLAEVVKQEGIEVQADEMEEEAERISSAYGEQADAVRNVLAQVGAKSVIASDLLAKRAMDRLIAIATGQAGEESAGDTVASPAVAAMAPEDAAPEVAAPEVAAPGVAAPEGEAVPEGATEPSDASEDGS